MVLAFLDTWVTTALLLGLIIRMIKPEGRPSLKFPRDRWPFSLLFCLHFLQLSSKRGIDGEAASSGGARCDTGGFAGWQRRDYQRRLQAQMQHFAGGRLVFLK